MTTSVFRNKRYNTAIGGARQSLHMSFNAIDFIVKGTTLHLAQWAELLFEMRSGGIFEGYVKAYSHFVHVDTRGNI